LDVESTLILMRNRCRFLSICIFLLSPCRSGNAIARTEKSTGMARKTYLKIPSVATSGNRKTRVAATAMPVITSGRAYLVKYVAMGMSIDWYRRLKLPRAMDLAYTANGRPLTPFF